MDELRTQALDVLETLNEEQMILVLAYARCLKDGEAAAGIATGLEELLQELA